MRLSTLILLIWLVIPGLSAWAEIAESEVPRDNWLDRSHQNLEIRTQQAAIWFDNFFADDYSDQSPATAKGSITIGGRTSRNDTGDIYTKVRINAKFPNLKERFYLELSNEDEVERDLPTLEARRPQEIQAETDDNNYSAALRWIKRSTVKELIDARVGVRSGSHAYLAGRHRRYHNLTKAVKLHLTPTVFIDSEYGAGVRLLTEFDHLFEHPGLVRFSVRGQFDNRSEGVEWRSGLSYIYRLSKKGAVVAGFYVRGESDGDESIEKYSTSVRLRKQFWRPYLFYEIEPYLDWPADDGFRTDRGIAFSISMVIGD